MKQLELHEYQDEAVEHCIKHKKAMLFGSIGSGKTVVALEVIKRLKNSLQIQTAVIFAPPKVVTHTYKNEFKKWENFRYLTYRILHGTKKDHLIHQKADVYVVSYNSIEWFFENCPHTIDLLVLDESHFIKSSKSKRFKKLKKYTAEIPYKVDMTGSPIGNNIQDLWSQYFILDRGRRLFNTWTTFLSYWFVPSLNGYSWHPKRGTRQDITKRVSDITYEIPATKVALPELQKNIIKLQLPGGLQQKYEELEKEAILEFGAANIAAFDIGTLLQKLRQFSCGFLYDEERPVRVHDLKIKALEARLAEAGSRVMVVANFREEFEMLKAYFPGIRCINGVTSNSEANKTLDLWNAGELDLLAVHPKSAGTGLNLQGGGYRQIWLSPDWSLLDRNQTIGRLYRQGQESKVVIVDNFIVEGTVEETIMSAIEKKISTVNGFIGELRKNWGLEE